MTFISFKENYALTDKSYVIGVAQLDYDKSITVYDMRTVLVQVTDIKF